MLISKLRRTIHYFLTGLEMVGNFNLGLIDWEHDPHFLKHSILIYKIEDSKHDGEDNDLDVLLGPKWDIVDMSITMDSFRIGKDLQWCALENQQSPFYVVNEVTLTGPNPSLKVC